jgi:hypothetical protein
MNGNSTEAKRQFPEFWEPSPRPSEQSCGGCRGDWSDTTAHPSDWRDGACGFHLAAAHLRHALDSRGGDPQAWGDHVVEAAERLLGEVWR